MSIEMNRRGLLKWGMVAGAGIVVGPWASRLRAAEGGAEKKVLFLTKSSGFQHSVITRDPENPQALAHAEKILTQMGKEHSVDVTVTKDADVFNDPRTYQTYDAFAFYTTGDLTVDSERHAVVKGKKKGEKAQPGKFMHTEKPMSAEGKTAFLQSIKDGKGFIGFHCASDTFHTPHLNKDELLKNDGRPEKAEYDPYIQMIGGEFVIHGSQQPSTMHVVDPNFPGMKGVEDFTLQEEWYSLANFSPTLHVILMQETKGMKGPMYEQRKPYPATWARMYGKGRVYFTSMGHREDVWTNPLFQQIVNGGMAWVVGHVDADVTPNIEKVAPYVLPKPSVG